jgi:hypothetical protein
MNWTSSQRLPTQHTRIRVIRREAQSQRHRHGRRQYLLMTAEAVRQCRQTVRRIKRERPQARIVVTSCGADRSVSFATMPEVALVVGNRTSSALKLGARPQPTQACMPARDAGVVRRRRRRKIKVNDIMAVGNRGASHRQARGAVRAFVRVQVDATIAAHRLIPMVAAIHARCPWASGGAGAKPVRARLPRSDRRRAAIMGRACRAPKLGAWFGRSSSMCRAAARRHRSIPWRWTTTC